MAAQTNIVSSMNVGDHLTPAPVIALFSAIAQKFETVGSFETRVSYEDAPLESDAKLRRLS